MALVEDANVDVDAPPVGPGDRQAQAVGRCRRAHGQLFAMKAMVGVACAFADHQEGDIRSRRRPPSTGAPRRCGRCTTIPAGARRPGYERATSLYARGDRPTAVEMACATRASNRISRALAVMHLIMAREALDTHFKLMMPILQPKPGQKVSKGEA